METLDYWLEPDLVIALRHDVERHAEKILRLRKTLEELASLRNAVEVRQIGPPRSFDASR